MNIRIVRQKYTGEVILGKMIVEMGGMQIMMDTLENEKKAIPKGIYDIVYEYSPKFNVYLWELKGVKNRSEIKIHAGNHLRETEGCILVGDRDKKNDYIIHNSRKAVQALAWMLRNIRETKIKIE